MRRGGETERRQTAAEPRTFYRIIQSRTPGRIDFVSNEAKGVPLRRDTAQARRLWTGISVFDSEAGAREMARRFPGLGAFVAALRIPVDALIGIERTTATPGHFTLWGEPDDILNCVADVVPV